MKRHTHTGRELSAVLRREQPYYGSEKLPEFLRFYVRKDLMDTLKNNSND